MCTRCGWTDPPSRAPLSWAHPSTRPKRRCPPTGSSLSADGGGGLGHVWSARARGLGRLCRHHQRPLVRRPRGALRQHGPRLAVLQPPLHRMILLVHSATCQIPCHRHRTPICPADLKGIGTTSNCVSHRHVGGPTRLPPRRRTSWCGASWGGARGLACRAV